MRQLIFIAVGFRQAADHTLHVLLAVDDAQSGEQLFDGHPVVMVSHFPGGSSDALSIDPADAASDLHEHVQTAAPRIVEVLETTFDAEGVVQDHMLLGIRIGP